jgi:protoporphyrin/coproporphyrin ferrochelatase
MTYGSATVAENVEAYMRHIYGDKASQETIRDFERRYRLVGHSPLVEITRMQAEALQEKLGAGYVVRSAMRHSEPYIHDVVLECKKDGVDRIVGTILSPQFSSYIMEGYKKALFDAVRDVGFEDKDITIAEPWPTEGHFIELLSKRIRAKLEQLRVLYGKNIPIIFTTHSLPERVVKSDPSYLEELKATTDAVLKLLDDPSLEHYSGYQSAGHTPEAWLKPDLTDVLAELAKKKAPAVLIAPIQFLADHLEILYDLDIAGAEQCAEHGIAYNRIELPNADPLFIDSLAATAKHTEKDIA